MTEFRDSIDIAAPPETVFDYLTTNDGMTAWMGQYADLDPTPGGRFAVDIAGHPVRGTYLHVDPPNRVVVSWGFAGSDDLPAGSSTVEFRLTPTDRGTRSTCATPTFLTRPCADTHSAGQTSSPGWPLPEPVATRGRTIGNR